jgi:hypothetical protein
MPSEKILRPYQPRLPLAKATLWDQLPEPTRARVRQLLTQMLQQAILNPDPERSSHERQD